MENNDNFMDESSSMLINDRKPQLVSNFDSNNNINTNNDIKEEESIDNFDLKDLNRSPNLNNNSVKKIENNIGAFNMMNNESTIHKVNNKESEFNMDSLNLQNFQNINDINNKQPQQQNRESEFFMESIIDENIKYKDTIFRVDEEDLIDNNRFKKENSEPKFAIDSLDSKVIEENIQVNKESEFIMESLDFRKKEPLPPTEEIHSKVKNNSKPMEESHNSNLIVDSKYIKEIDESNYIEVNNTNNTLKRKKSLRSIFDNSKRNVSILSNRSKNLDNTSKFETLNLNNEEKYEIYKNENKKLKKILIEKNNAIKDLELKKKQLQKENIILIKNIDNKDIDNSLKDKIIKLNNDLSKLKTKYNIEKNLNITNKSYINSLETKNSNFKTEISQVSYNNKLKIEKISRERMEVMEKEIALKLCQEDNSIIKALVLKKVDDLESKNNYNKIKLEELSAKVKNLEKEKKLISKEFEQEKKLNNDLKENLTKYSYVHELLNKNPSKGFEEIIDTLKDKMSKKDEFIRLQKIKINEYQVRDNCLFSII